MIKKNCIWCGRHVIDGTYCTNICKQLQEEMMSRPFSIFHSYAQASKYLGKICGQSFKTQENRAVYCPQCSKAGEGRKAQAKKIAELYQGQGNPNYVNGKIKQTFRHQNSGKKWAKAVVMESVKCLPIGEFHHSILPTRSLEQEETSTSKDTS